MADQSWGDGSQAPDGQAPDRARRWRQMLDLLAERGRLSVSETAVALSVSEATVRRDFTELARQQLVTRTHGGVLATSVAYDLPARYRASSEHGPKERIAAAAADMLESGTVVGFNGGTTTSATARRLASRVEHGPQSGEPALTVVTNALNIAAEMVLRPHVRTVSLGGVARPQSYEMTGPLASLVLNELWLDTLILGVDGLTATGGASCRHVGEAGINALMVQRADRVVIVGGGEKIGQRAFARICDIDRVNVLITDASAPDDDVAALEAAGVDVRLI